jgi:cyanuric acid amidohydrolase
MADADVSDPAEVHAVMVKAPALSQATIREAEERGRTVVTRDLGIGPEGAMCYSNDGSALGVALALGEVPAHALSDEVVRRDWSLYSSVAATSSGGEKRRAEVLLLANRTPTLSTLRVGHALLRDAIDAEGVADALRSAGLGFACRPSDEQRARIVQVFAKYTLPGSDVVRGNRITLLDDHDAYHVAKAIGGALVASVTGTTTAFVSGGERNSHMGPPGANPVAAVVRTEAPMA